MARKQMWMGTRGYEMWVPCPAINMGQSQVGFMSQNTYLDGGAGIRASTASHAEYDMSWNLKSRDEIRPILDMASGVYDSQDGVNLIYFVSPMAARKNLAPGHIGTPSQAGDDGMPIFQDLDPVLVPTPNSGLGYPARSAQYTATRRSLATYFPIPPGYVLWVGVHGDNGIGAVFPRVVPFTGVSPGTPLTPAMLSTGTSTRVNASVSSAAGYTGAELDFDVTSAYTQVNYSTNPSMETDIDGYSPVFASGDVIVMSRQTGGGFSGAAFLRQTYSAIGGGGFGGKGGFSFNVDVSDVATGAPVSFSMRVRTSIINNVRVDSQWFDEDGNSLGPVGSANATTVAGGVWGASAELKVENKTKPPTGHTIAFFVTVDPTLGTAFGIGGWMDLDAIMVNEGATALAYKDGNSAGWQWDGLVNESVSRAIGGVITLSGIIVQCLPIGETPELGGFISGQGHSGCQFAGKPTQSAYSAALDKVGVSAKLVETGAWL